MRIINIKTSLLVCLVIVFLISGCSDSFRTGRVHAHIQFSPAIELEEAIGYAKTHRADISKLRIENVRFQEVESGGVVIVPSEGDQWIRFDSLMAPDNLSDQIAALYFASIKEMQEFGDEHDDLVHELEVFMNADSLEYEQIMRAQRSGMYLAKLERKIARAEVIGIEAEIRAQVSREAYLKSVKVSFISLDMSIWQALDKNPPVKSAHWGLY